MKRQNAFPINNDEGSVLMFAVLIMIILTSIGIFAINTSSVEMQLSGNEKFHKQAFYNSEGGLRLVYPLLLDIIIEGENPTGLPGNYPGITFDGTDAFWDEDIDDDNSQNEATPDLTVAACNNVQVDIDRLSPDRVGDSLLNRAGYEGLGRGLAADYIAGYRVMATGSSALNSQSQTSATIYVVR